MNYNHQNHHPIRTVDMETYGLAGVDFLLEWNSLAGQNGRAIFLDGN